jgi:acyl carrier protein
MAEKAQVLVSCVRELVARSLGLSIAEPIEADRPLAEVGLDSLLAVEVRSVLGAALGRTLPASLLFDYPTLDAIAGYLGREVFKAEPWVRMETAAGAPVGDALSSIEQMDDEEVERLLAGRLSSGGAS